MRRTIARGSSAMPLWLPRLHHGLGRPAFEFSARPLVLLLQALPSFAHGQSKQREAAGSSRAVVAAAPVEPFTLYGA